MDIKDIDLKQIGFSDEFLLRWISKDLITGMHFCYLKIDKRNLTKNFEEDEKTMVELYCQSIIIHASRYAFLTFEEEVARQLKIQIVNVKFIKETYEESEDTTWLIYEFAFAFIKENENGKKVCFSNASAINCMKSDYAPRVLAEKVEAKMPELNGMKVGEVKAFGKKTLEKIVEVIEDENKNENENE